MTAWRMAFREGKNGYELWDTCRNHGVAAIQYDPVQDVDFSGYKVEELLPPNVREKMSGLRGSQVESLRRFLWAMKKGDIIYVKKGPMIVGKGVIGPYKFDKRSQVYAPKGKCWQHQRPVIWDPGFGEITIQIGQPQITAVVPLDEKDVKRIDGKRARRTHFRSCPVVRSRHRRRLRMSRNHATMLLFVTTC